MKRKSNQQTLGQVIKDFLRQSGWERKLDEVKIMTEWDKVLGPSLAKYTEEVFIQNNKLHIRLNSSTLRQELSYKKSEIVKELNEAVGMIKDANERLEKDVSNIDQAFYERLNATLASLDEVIQKGINRGGPRDP